MKKVNLLPKLLDDFELAEMLGVRPGWVAARGRKGEIPSIPLGRYRRYDPQSEEFKTWLDGLRASRYDAEQSKKDGPEKEKDHMARSSYQIGSIEQRERKQGTVWVLRYRLRNGNQWTGKTEELPVAADASGKVARRVADKRMVQINQRNGGYRPRLTFNQFKGELWQSYQQRLKPSTAANYASHIETHLQPLFGEKHLDEITPGDITLMLAEAAKKIGQSTLLTVYCVANLFFEIASEYDLIEVNPVRRKLHRPQVVKKEKPVLEPEQIRAVIDCPEAEHRAILSLLALTGIRIGELQALRWCDVDFVGRRLTINHTLWRRKLYPPKSKSSRRTLHLAEPLVNELQAHRHRSRWTDQTDFVFCRADGQPLRANYLHTRVLRPALDRAGITRGKGTHGFHLFRHSAATILEEETRGLRAARDLLGHEKETTTTIYSHSQRDTFEAVEILASKIVGCDLNVTESMEMVQ